MFLEGCFGIEQALQPIILSKTDSSTTLRVVCELKNDSESRATFLLPEFHSLVSIELLNHEKAFYS